MHRAPHKPFLLLSILDLIEEGKITENFVELNDEIIEGFFRYWYSIFPDEKTTKPFYPFFHMRSEPFWELVPVPEKEGELRDLSQITSFTRFYDLVLGAKFTEPYYKKISTGDFRQQIRTVLLDEYFDYETAEKIKDTGAFLKKEILYSRQLEKKLSDSFEPFVSDVTETTTYNKQVRDAGFRRTVRNAYDHYCAFCDLKLLTPERRSVVVAAHIIPRGKSSNDDPRNGLSLCKLHHWTFDRGLVTVTENRSIAVSSIVENPEQNPGSLPKLDGKTARLPENDRYHPAKEALQWHRENTYLDH